jgi:hypothetical protein
MIDNMFTVMKRINEIKSRFGMNRRRPAARTRDLSSPMTYGEYQRRAVASASAPPGGKGRKRYRGDKRQDR